ncbi:MAG: hypothetical protein QGH06_01895, partial [Lutibacter sp.]|nr:hypothetical protein [Lutibacter sp.]
MIDKRLTNKTFVYLFFLAVSLTAVFNLSYNNTAKEASIESLREQHALHLANSPFQETLQLSKAERKSKGIPPNKYQERMWELTMDPATGRPHPERLFALQASLRGATTTNKVPGGPEAYSSWQERGPNNVGGRTRALMFDPNDNTHKRVFAGGVSGGLWVNQDITDANSSWSLVDMPENLAVSCLAYDPNNTNTFYLGTGESYVSGGVNGNGVWKSTDAGNSWTQIFGGVTGETTFETNTKLSVDSPVSIAGDYVATSASFGPALTSTPLTGELVLADDGTAASTEACNPLINSAEVNGKIAVIKRGNCTFVSKVKNAQDAGAIAVLVINNVVGPPISMGGEDTTITIPAIMVSDEDGAAIINELANGVQVTMEKTDNPFGGTFVTPGIQHINDIKVRDVDGSTSEVYVAAGSAPYAASSPYTWLGLEQAGLYRSNNDGTSWSAVSLPLTSGGSNYAPNDIEIGADNAVWIATTNNPLGGEGGGTILHAADGLNFVVKHEINEGDRTQIALSGSNPDVVYVLGETGNSEAPIALLKTTDAFANVTETALPDDADLDIADNDFTRGQAFYDLMLEVDPTDDAILYAGGIDLFRSPDAGDSWDQISKWSNNNMLGSLNVSYVHADHHILVFNPGNPNRGIFGTDGGVFYGNDLASAPNNNQAIAARNKDYNTVQFYKGAIGAETTAEKLLAGAQDNGSHLINNATGGIAPSTH